MDTSPPEPSFFPYSLCLDLMKDIETLVEVVAHHFYDDDNKCNFIAFTEATKVLARLSLSRDSGYKMLLQGVETFGENARMLSDPTWFRRAEHHQHAIMELPGSNVNRSKPTLSSFLSEEGVKRTYRHKLLTIWIENIIKPVGRGALAEAALAET
ncbi:peroxisome biogenesis protein 16-like protein isoform X1 [Tanacetum coccineum]